MVGLKEERVPCRTLCKRTSCFLVRVWVGGLRFLAGGWLQAAVVVVDLETTPNRDCVFFFFFHISFLVGTREMIGWEGRLFCTERSGGLEESSCSLSFGVASTGRPAGREEMGIRFRLVLCGVWP